MAALAAMRVEPRDHDVVVGGGDADDAQEGGRRVGVGSNHRPALFDLSPGEALVWPVNRGFPGTPFREDPGTLSRTAPIAAIS